VVVDPQGPGAAARINEASAREQHAIMEHLGMSDLLRGAGHGR
jgi:hypothetical protein